MQKQTESLLSYRQPLRSIDGAEYVPQEADDGRFFGLRPILQKLDNVAATTALDPCIDGEAGSAAADDESGEDSDAMYSSDEEDTTADVFSTTAHSLSTRREHDVLVEVVRKIQFPEGSGGNARPIQWNDVFVKYNQEVYRQVKSKPSLGAHWRHASKYQLKQAYDRITNSVMVSTLLQRKSGNLDVYKNLRRVLRAPHLQTFPPRYPSWGGSGRCGLCRRLLQTTTRRT